MANTPIIQTTTDQAMLQAVQNLSVAIGTLNQTLTTLFPSASNLISGSAGAASGDFLTLTVAGVQYKLDLLLPS